MSVPPAEDGSTLSSTWTDPDGSGGLRTGAGEPPVDRTRLGPSEPLGAELARLVHISDAHVMDASSPARVPFLARFGRPLQSTFRPQEALTAQVLHGAVNAARAQRPQLVLQGGDLIDNAQRNELEQALSLLNGGSVTSGSGPRGYFGVQLASNDDPLYYRPDVDAPRHPGMLEQAVRPFMSSGLGGDWLPVLGDHDALVQGELLPSAVTRRLATGDRALWKMPDELALPAEFELSSLGPPGEPLDPRLVEAFVEQALAGSTVPVPPDPRRDELTFAELIDSLWDGSQAAAQARVRSAESVTGRTRLDCVADVGDLLRLIVLDTVRRSGGSGGCCPDEQAAWLEAQLARSGERWVMVVSHHPIEDCAGGERVFSILDRAPRVIAALAGHTHRNRIIPRESAAGGYWLITTGSLIDFPQQCRALRVHATAGGGAAIVTWMLDHVGNGPLGSISRELAYRDALDGRLEHLIGTRWDRNATLFRRAVR